MMPDEFEAVFDKTLVHVSPVLKEFQQAHAKAKLFRDRMTGTWTT
jgi:hypothetical protein